MWIYFEAMSTQATQCTCYVQNIHSSKIYAAIIYILILSSLHLFLPLSKKKLASNFFKHHFPGCQTPSFFTFNQKQPDPLNSLTAKNQVHHVADRWDFWRQQKWTMEKSHTFPQRLLRFKHKFKGGADFYCLMSIAKKYVSFLEKEGWIHGPFLFEALM